ncbi:AlpA family transcriptional regulator [Nitrosomonas sp. Nm33]|uniref:helix-turn-helix transcriptional regulator n=1 Tax=Nitrosomonas sp. Nm33 TaxID=133724 RepID=UPI00089B9FFB|nr:AlpA family phage regulatory protein [Nitrosomonas sp. Nm33]SDY68707.1 prophage regulatory protein [Nitrosomonas sp. Nm33]
MAMQNLSFKKKPAVLEQTSFSHANLYLRIRKGLFPSPVKIGRTSVWIDSEINTMCKAHAAGLNDVKLRELVEKLKADRKNLMQ